MTLALTAIAPTNLKMGTPYAQALGSHFRSLPWAVRTMHHALGWRVFVGRTSVRRGRNWIARLAGWCFSFPPSLANAACRVEFRATATGEEWWRRFGGHPMRSILSVEHGHLFGRFGPLKSELIITKRGGTLVIRSGRSWFGPFPFHASSRPT